MAMVTFALLALATACDKENEDSAGERAVDQTKSQPAESVDTGPAPPPREIFGERHERAVELMGRIVGAVEEHFEAAEEPEAATFPGGTGVEWTSVDAPPEKGATYRLATDGTIGTESADVAAGSSAETSSRDPVAAALGLEPGAELPVQIRYQTGDGTGPEATATIRAVADFDPSAEADHTLIQELSVDPKTGDVNVFPRLTQHRWK